MDDDGGAVAEYLGRGLLAADIRAEDSEKLTEFDDLSLIQLIVQRGEAFVKDLPEGIRKNQEAVAETIENNVRKLIIDEQPINPKYYEKMSELLDALIAQRQQMALDYAEYLEKIIRLTKQVVNPGGGTDYPTALDTSGKRALYDNLDRDESLALAVHAAVLSNRQDSWRGNRIKTLKIKFGILGVLDARETDGNSPAGAAPAAEAPSDAVRRRAEAILEIVRNQNEY